MAPGYRTATNPAEIDQAAILQVGAATVDDPDPCGCTNDNVNCRNFEQTDAAMARRLAIDGVVAQLAEIAEWGARKYGRADATSL